MVVRLGIPPWDIIPGFQGKFLTVGIIWASTSPAAASTEIANIHTRRLNRSVPSLRIWFSFCVSISGKPHRALPPNPDTSRDCREYGASWDCARTTALAIIAAIARQCEHTFSGHVCSLSSGFFMIRGGVARSNFPACRTNVGMQQKAA